MKRGVSAITVVVIVLLLLAAGTAGSYYLLKKQANSEKNLQSQIDDLRNKYSQSQPSASSESTASADDTTAASTSDSSLKSYSNPTYGYSLEYPKDWTIKQANTLESTTEAVKDSNIQFYSGSTLKLSIITEAKSKVGTQTLSQYASDLTPKDKTTISGKTTYTIGDLEGVKELVRVSDPASEGLYYFTQSDSYFFNFLSKEKTQSAEIKALLASFKLS